MTDMFYVYINLNLIFFLSMFKMLQTDVGMKIKLKGY